MFPQRRNVDARSVQPMEQIFAKPLVQDHLVDVRVGGGQDADVHPQRPGLTDRLNLLVLDQAQQLGLDVRVELPDLVQQHGASAGAADDPGCVVAGAGECSAPVAEELRVDYLPGGAGAVVGDELLSGAIGTVVDDARDNLLARARLTRDQNGQLAVCGQRGDPQHLLHHVRCEDALGRLRITRAVDVSVAIHCFSGSWRPVRGSGMGTGRRTTVQGRVLS